MVLHNSVFSMVPVGKPGTMVLSEHNFQSTFRRPTVRRQVPDLAQNIRMVCLHLGFRDSKERVLVI